MVQVIPKKIEHRDKPGKNILPWLSLILVVIVLFVYFYFSRQLAATQAQMLDTREELMRVQDEDFRSMEREVLTHRRRIDDVLGLLETRNQASEPIAFLEENVHPRVYFSNFSLNMATGSLQLEGTAENFISVGEQIYILKKQDFISKVYLSSVNVADPGEIVFKLELSLSAEKN